MKTLDDNTAQLPIVRCSLPSLLEHEDLHNAHDCAVGRQDFLALSTVRIKPEEGGRTEVDRVDDERDALANRVSRHATLFSHLGVQENLLSVVKDEAREERDTYPHVYHQSRAKGILTTGRRERTSVRRHVLEDAHSSNGHSRHEHWREGAEDEDAEAGHEGSADVEELFGLRSRADVRQATLNESECKV